MTQRNEKNDIDFLHEAPDQHTSRLLDDLHRAYTTIPAPPDRMNWQSLIEQHRSENLAQQVSPLPRHLVSVRKFSLSLAAALSLALVVVVIASAAVFGIPSQLYEILGLINGGKAQLDHHQFTELNKSKTVNGVRITLNAAYADSCYIMIGITVNKEW